MPDSHIAIAVRARDLFVVDQLDRADAEQRRLLDDVGSEAADTDHGDAGAP